MHIHSGIFHDNSNSPSINKCHCALHVTGRGSQTLGASWFCRMLSSSCKDCARVSSRWAGGFNPQETHGKFRGNGNGRMNVFFSWKDMEIINLGWFFWAPSLIRSEGQWRFFLESNGLSFGSPKRFWWCPVVGQVGLFLGFFLLDLWQTY